MTDIIYYQKPKQPETIGNALKDRFNKPKKKTCAYQWQDRAFTVADKLGIDFKNNPRLLPQWLRFFKIAFTKGLETKLDRCYSFIVDYPKYLNTEAKVKLFYWKFTR
jgi:hypothetical protein